MMIAVIVLIGSTLLVVIIKDQCMCYHKPSLIGKKVIKKYTANITSNVKLLSDSSI